MGFQCTVIKSDAEAVAVSTLRNPGSCHPRCEHTDTTSHNILYVSYMQFMTRCIRKYILEYIHNMHGYAELMLDRLNVTNGQNLVRNM